MNIVLSAKLSSLTVSAYLHALFAGGHWIGAICMLGLPVVMGVSAYAMKKWSYAVFVVCASLILAQNFQAARDSRISLTFAASLYLSHIALITYFLLPSVRLPFFDKRVRWWETATRYLVKFGARFEIADGESRDESSDVCQIHDISVGGVFALLPVKIEDNRIIRLRFSPNGRHIFSIRAKVVFHRGQSETGYGHGLQFVELTSATRQMLVELIRELRATGCPSRDPSGSDWEDFKKWATRLLTTGKGLLPEYVQVQSRMSALVHGNHQAEQTKEAA
ncbi:MAG: PilZ domain-containing protein [Oligoflexia bacterium]|nr:PilZ domain-containing protein [Oligoflexia bacterium]